MQLGTYELINEIGGFISGDGFEMSADEKKAALKEKKKLESQTKVKKLKPIDWESPK